jgi:lipid-A-disaccharide synthase
MANRAKPAQSREQFCSGLGVPPQSTLIALLPGSRRREVELNLPPMLEAAHLLADQRTCEFVLPAAPGLDTESLRRKLGNLADRVHITRGQFHDTVAYARAAIVASGTASTETAILGTPMVIVYRVTGLSWFLGRRLVDIPFFSIVNLVAGREVVPELIQDRFTGPAVAAELGKLIDDGEPRARMVKDLQEVVAKLTTPPVAEGQGRQSAGEFADPIQRAAAIAESMLLG